MSKLIWIHWLKVNLSFQINKRVPRYPNQMVAKGQLVRAANKWLSHSQLFPTFDVIQCSSIISTTGTSHNGVNNIASFVLSSIWFIRFSPLNTCRAEHCSNSMNWADSKSNVDFLWMQSQCLTHQLQWSWKSHVPTDPCTVHVHSSRKVRAAIARFSDWLTAVHRGNDVVLPASILSVNENDDSRRVPNKLRIDTMMFPIVPNELNAVNQLLHRLWRRKFRSSLTLFLFFRIESKYLPVFSFAGPMNESKL